MYGRFKFDTGIGSEKVQTPRRSARRDTDAQVQLRRPGQYAYGARVLDLSRHGCRLEFVETPVLDERVSVRVGGLEPIAATVCWCVGHVAGLEFDKVIHPAVLDMVVARLSGAPPNDENCGNGRSRAA